ncbi:hypothetical protein [Ulvibacter antarcticus]|nr:hypothetical protein [Ulvibacter antarcticus]
MTYLFYVMFALFSSPNESILILPGEPNDDKIIMQDQTTTNSLLILPGEPNDDK